MRRFTNNLFEKWRLTGYVWRYILAAIFLSAGLLKLFSASQLLLAAGFQSWPLWITRTIEQGFPWIEIGLGLWLISGLLRKSALSGALLLTLAFVATNIYGLVSGDAGSCHCLGNIIALTHGQSLAADLLMLAMGIVAIRGVDHSLKTSPLRPVRRRFWPALITVALITLVLSAALPSAALEAGKQSGTLHPLMRPSVNELAAWETDYRGAPVYSAPDSGPALKAPPPVYSLLDYLDYNPAERDQGYVGNCWVWAGTGLMEIAMNVATGNKDRLSIQYLDSNYYHDGERAGCGGELTYFSSFYNGDPDYNQALVKHIAVPWSNSGGSYQDYNYGVCNNYSGAVVSITPNYPILNTITTLTVPTSGLPQARAIANIKSALLNKQAVFFGFYLPLTGNHSTWNSFFDFWSNGNESSEIWEPNVAEGQWPDVGGHAVVCVGYDDTNNSWILLNSWGTTGGRPNGTFRVTQDLNYNGTFSNGEDSNVTVFQWQTLSSMFNNSIPFVTTNEAAFLNISQAALLGNLSALGNSSTVNVSFEYGPTDNYGSTTPTQSMTAPGSFSATVSGLSPDITYHFRAKAVGTQIVYGQDMTFKTFPPPVPGSSDLTIALTVLGLGALMVLFLRFKVRPKSG